MHRRRFDLQDGGRRRNLQLFQAVSRRREGVRDLPELPLGGEELGELDLAEIVPDGRNP